MKSPTLTPRRPLRPWRTLAATIAINVIIASALLAALGPDAGTARAATIATSPPYVPGRLIVGYDPPILSVIADIRTTAHLRVTGTSTSQTPVAETITLPRDASVPQAAARIARLSGIAYAVPDYEAHAAGAWFPNDPGRTTQSGGWAKLQWSDLAADGIDAPAAWSNLIADHRPGAKGVVVAVLDTGVAFRDWEKYTESPDFAGTRFVDPCDLVAGKLVNGRCTDPDPLDREGHGTFVAGVIAEATNNHIGVTGLAYNASIMPVRVLDANGLGDASVIAAGIRYAVAHHAQVINLSLEFYLGVTPGDIPDILAAIRYAHDHNVMVVAAAGNDGATQIAYPARAPNVVAVGATTLDRCLADYSDVGTGLDLVAPGGGDDSNQLPGDPDCHPNRNLPDVYQMTFNNPARPDDFSLPGGWYGTSMAAPAVSAAAAMVIASGVIGRHPTPDQILARLEATADPLGPSTPNLDYGYGLLNVGAATSKNAPAPATTPTSS